jgi:hypothetical protein
MPQINRMAIRATTTRAEDTQYLHFGIRRCTGCSIG